jgi:hypothetical protein
MGRCRCRRLARPATRVASPALGHPLSTGVASPALRRALPRSPLRTLCMSSEAELVMESTKIQLGMTGSLYPKAEL